MAGPGTFYRPSLAVTLRLRFDEAYTVDETPDPVSVAGQQNGAFKEQKPSVRPLLLEGGPDELDAAARRVADAQAAAGSLGATRQAALEASSLLSNDPGRLSVIVQRVPINAQVELPGYVQAGSFSLTFEWRDLPIDPRVVRACGVEIYMGSISQQDFAAGMNKVEPDGTRRSIVRPDPENLVLVGVVDDWSNSFSDRESTVTITGRDLRGMLLDSPVEPKLFKDLKLDKPIHDVVKQIVMRHPFGSRIVVKINEDDWSETLPGVGGGALGATSFPRKIPSPGTKDKLTAIRVSVGNDGSGGGQARSTPPGGSGNLNFWDLITRYCMLVGAVPYFRGEQLWIRPSKSIYDQTNSGMDPSTPTPFKDGKPRYVPVGDPVTQKALTVRAMVYGRDIADLKFERKQSGVKMRQIQCVSINTDAKDRKQRLITAVWPDPKDKPKSAKTSVAPSGAATMTDALRIPVPGIKSVEALKEVARGIYQSVARGEMGGSFTTKSLASFGGDANDTDLLRIRPGDGVELLVDTRRLTQNNPLNNELTNSYRRSFQEQVDEVSQRLGGSNPNQGVKDLARVLVATARGRIIELQPFWRISTVHYNWSKDELVIAADFQNYIEVRGDGKAQGPNTKAPTTVAAPRRLA